MAGKLNKGDLVTFEGKDQIVVGFDEINEAPILEDENGEQTTVDMDLIEFQDETQEVHSESEAEDEGVENTDTDETVDESEQEYDTEQLDELTKAGETIKGKANYNTSQMTARVIQAMSSMKSGDAIDFFNKTMSQYGKGKDWGVGNPAAKNKSSVQTHNPNQDTQTPGQMAGKVKSMAKEDLDKILGDEANLTEEFKEKASTLFEATVNLRVALVQEELEALYEDKLAEEMAELTESLEENIDQYLSRATEEWLTENEVAVESTLRNKMTEDFMADLFGLFKEYNFELPEDSIDVVEAMTSENEELKAKLNEQINTNLDLCEAIENYAADEIFDEVSEGLALTQIEKFKTLAEDIDFDGDEDAYRNKLEVVKEQLFEKKAKPTSTLNEEVEIDEPETEKKSVSTDPSIAAYELAISRTTKR